MFVSIVCLFVHDIEWMTCKRKGFLCLRKKGFFFAVDYPLNYEYNKVIGLPTYPMPILYYRIVIFYNNCSNNSLSNFTYWKFVSFIVFIFSSIRTIVQLVMRRTMCFSDEKSTAENPKMMTMIDDLSSAYKMVRILIL